MEPRGTYAARKFPDLLRKESQRDARSRELLPCNNEAIDWKYKRRCDAKMPEIRRQAEALESLALDGQDVEISSVELVNQLEQQLIWEVEEGHRYSFLLG